MSMEQTPEEHDMLAAEYAMGLLSGDELVTAKRLATTDSAFAQLVTQWEIRLASMTDTLAPEQPRAAVKAALLAQVFPAAPRQPLWQKLWLWQGLSALSVLALVVLLASGPQTQPPVSGPVYTAEIVSQAGDFRVVAVVDKTTNEVFLTRTAGAAPEGRILQVWAHGEGAPATSVGLWPQGDTIRIAMPQDIAAVEGILTLGVSEEPVGGSPTGSPTGRVFGTVDIPGVSNSI